MLKLIILGGCHGLSSLLKPQDLQHTPGCVFPPNLDVTEERAAPSNYIYVI